MKDHFLYLFLFMLSFTLWAQSTSLRIPLDIQSAYQNGTRAYDGQPGKRYWSNHSAYKMKVTFDPVSRLLKGRSVITYHNESPDTLDKIVLRLYADIFKKGAVRDWPANPDDLSDGVNIEFLSLNGTVRDLNAEDNGIQRQGTNMSVQLDDPLPPAAQLIMGVNWNFTLPEKSRLRMGMYDSSSFFIAYWYPQVAVYDDINGWDRYNYGGLQEFYNDANTFDVHISVPNNFTVFASGLLQNPQELLPDDIYKRYQKGLTSDSVVHLLDSSDVQTRRFTINPAGKDWHFIGKTIPDFAFALSDHYLWDMTSLVVDSASGRRTVVQTGYKKESSDFYDVITIARASLRYFSSELPGVPFPYPRLTVFNGGGGMEFPMMVNDGSSNRLSGTVHVTSHEIAHSYFPFYMGTNERKYAWMDEGWATMLPDVIQHRLAPNYDPIARNIKRFSEVSGSELDIPMMVPTIVYGSNVFRPSYRNAAYSRPGAAYLTLQNILGEKLFAKALQEYIRRWHHKHPIPYDFFFTFNEVSGQDLSWFWKPWFFDFGYPDLGIKKIHRTKTGTDIIINKIGSLPVPIYLELETEDGTHLTVKKSATVWKDSNSDFGIHLDLFKKIKKARLGNGHIPDVNEKNNLWLKK